MSLSQVKEELSGISRDTEGLNTPNNESNNENLHPFHDVHREDISMQDVSSSADINMLSSTIAAMEETKV